MSAPEKLHANAAHRVLRAEMLRLNDSRLELLAAADDPRIPAGVITAQLNACDREIGEIIGALHLLEAADEAEKAAA